MSSFYSQNILSMIDKNKYMVPKKLSELFQFFIFHFIRSLKLLFCFIFGGASHNVFKKPCMGNLRNLLTRYFSKKLDIHFFIK